MNENHLNKSGPGSDRDKTLEAARESNGVEAPRATDLVKAEATKTSEETIKKSTVGVSRDHQKPQPKKQ